MLNFARGFFQALFRWQLVMWGYAWLELVVGVV